MGRFRKKLREFWNILVYLVGLSAFALVFLGSSVYSFLHKGRALFEGRTTYAVIFLRERLEELKSKDQTELYYWILNPNTYFEQLIWPSDEELSRRKVGT